MSKITGKVTYKEVLKGDTGYTFEPHVTVDGILYWTNNGNLENPLPVNLHGKQGFMFIPHVDSEGNLSWTNTGELENPPTVNIKGDKGYFYTPHISQDGVLTWSNNGGLENPQPFNISDLILNEVKESRVDTTGKTFSKLKERLDSDFKKLSESIKNNDTKDEVVQARTATTGENFMTLDDRIDHEVMRLREKIEVTMLEQEDKESHDISNTIDGMSSDMIIKGKTIKLDNGEIKSFGRDENKISILSHGKNLFDGKSTDCFWFGNVGEKIPNNNINVTQYSIVVPVKKGLQYSFSGYSNIPKSSQRYSVFFTDTNKTIIKTGSIIDKIVAPSDGFVYWYVCSEDVKPYLKDLQVEEGIQVTPYEPYKCDKKDILLLDLGFDEGLKGLGIAQDEINSNKNKILKKIEKYTFKGDENIVVHSMRDKTIPFTLYFSDSFLRGKNNNENFLCNSIETTTRCYSKDIEGVFGTSDGLYGSISKTKLESNDRDGVVKYVRENFKECYYELAEPVETPLNENINVKTFNDKTYVNFENSIKGASSFKVPVNTNKLINDLKFEKEDLKEKFNNLTNEFENFKTYMIQTLPYKEV